MQEIQLPDGSVVEFPDGIAQAAMLGVIQKHSVVGGILHSIMNPQFLERYRKPTGELVADVLPGIGHKRAIDRIREKAASMEEQSTIGKVLSGADIVLEGAGFVADVIPGLKALGVAAGALAPLVKKLANLPPAKTSRLKGMVVAARTPDGEILKGKQGQIHLQLMEDERLLSGTAEMGFADESGKFLNREEALDYAHSLYDDVPSHTIGMEHMLSGEELKEASKFLPTKK